MVIRPFMDWFLLQLRKTHLNSTKNPPHRNTTRNLPFSKPKTYISYQVSLTAPVVTWSLAGILFARRLNVLGPVRDQLKSVRIIPLYNTWQNSFLCNLLVVPWIWQMCFFSIWNKANVINTSRVWQYVISQNIIFSNRWDPDMIVTVL